MLSGALSVDVQGQRVSEIRLNKEGGIDKVETAGGKANRAQGRLDIRYIDGQVPETMEFFPGEPGSTTRCSELQ